MFTSAISTPQALTPSRGKGQGWKRCYWFKCLSKNSSASALVFHPTLLYLYMITDNVHFPRAAKPRKKKKSKPNISPLAKVNELNQNQEMPLQNPVS